MKEIMDGNKACAHVSYMFSEIAGIYPITPASNMAENIDEMSAKNILNFFDDKVKVIEMQSEAGAIATVHGALQNGVLATTYTASQGLLLMLSNMYKIAGELLPCVVNVAARTIATHALSIMGDHSDIYAARSTGFAIWANSSVQQVMDLTSIPYLVTLKSRIPFINFFDGFRTSHEFNKIDLIDLNKVKALIDEESLLNFRTKSLDIDNPTTRGSAQGDNIYFQNVEARNEYYNKLPDIVNDYLKEINKITNKDYKPFNYYGAKDAKKVIVAMGSVCETIKEYIDYKQTDIGLIEVHLYRPFSTKYFLEVLPKTTMKIAVLDRTKEAGSQGEPLYLDICEIINKNKLDLDVVGGRYGLSSKDTNLADIESVYNYLDNDDLSTFTIGIIDDVTNLSLPRSNTVFPKTCDEMLIWGYGSDGMVTASKALLTITGENTDKYVQGYFEYDSKKSGGVTKSHLRFSDDVIRSTYYVTNPSVVICSKDTYLKKYDILSGIKPNGTFILNTLHDVNSLNEVLTSDIIDIIKTKNINFYIINASDIAKENNIPNKISMIMETIIFKITNIINFDLAFNEIKDFINITFAKKGEDVINSNLLAISNSIDSIIKVDINNLSSIISKEKQKETVFSYLDVMKGNELKVSAFANDKANGIYEPGLSALEKRGISDVVPCYVSENCIMCNLCSFVCPHAVIRPYLLDEKEVLEANEEVKNDLLDAKIKDKDLSFTIGVSTKDCTGCTLCEKVCPSKAIIMKSLEEVQAKEDKKFVYLEKVKDKDLPVNTVKNSQFKKPNFAFSGACAGCGETAYLKLLSQIFGDNLIIANATGCSSIYGASLPSTPYTVPWVNSLFEDNAEFGYGIRIAEDFMKNKIINLMNKYKDSLNDSNKELVNKYLNNYSKEVGIEVYNKLDYDNFKEIIPYKKYLKEKSIWLVGGDGWAYDIGFGGIDHVIANNENVNILVLDTEVYSNTGGQSSKSTRYGARAKFQAMGKKTNKKNLAKIAMTYPNCYVATISLGANYNQTLQTLIEANNYNGPAIIIAYAPCIAHGIKQGMSETTKEQKLIADSGYFPLFRYNPDTLEFKLDSKMDESLIDEIFQKENRYSILNNTELLNKNKEEIKETYQYFESLTKK